jgi:hypothetical protein
MQLRMAVEARDTGAATLEKLDENGLAMRRIQGGQAQVQVNLDTSNKILKNMTSFMGWRTWGQKAEPKQKGAKDDALAEEKTEAAAAVRANADAARKAVRAAQGVGNSGVPASVGGSSAAEPPDAMDQISAMLSEMHAQGVAMNAELKAQDPLLDDLVETAVNHNEQVHFARWRPRRARGDLTLAVPIAGAQSDKADRLCRWTRSKESHEGGFWVRSGEHSHESCGSRPYDTHCSDACDEVKMKCRWGVQSIPPLSLPIPCRSCPIPFTARQSVPCRISEHLEYWECQDLERHKREEETASARRQGTTFGSEPQ